ncbi:TIGR04255 family protein [Pantoea agglomerans]|uniref:TIGR04255 family protein n=1 Tax=Enterobacter agglomerans TaxID=549 RepID=A0AAN2FEX2_ENTAG|nr:TIGR04255 family protein [Pantoea agglomerans]MBD8197370.1 TIGR04255 family protein [Pantoea agglomerans]CAH6333186.1 TIGR04255 family protein [Pantoea agglomerans]
MHKRIPTSLAKQPLIEAVFELRYSKETQISEIMPGFLFHALNCEKPITHTQASQIPKNVRDADEDMHYAVISRLEFEGYYIGLSDHGITISSISSNYEGWSAFKKVILRVIEEVGKLKVNESVMRYAIKYVDFFKSNQDGSSQLDKLDLNISLAGEDVLNDPINLRVDKNNKDYSNGIQILSHALVLTESGTYERKGMILDIETARYIKSDNELKDFISNTDSALDNIHQCNLKTFFSCLKDTTIEELEPIYNNSGGS